MLRANLNTSRQSENRPAREAILEGARPAWSWLLTRVLAGCLLLGLVLPFACNQRPKQPAPPPKIPTLRLYVASSIAGALEPCGCRKDMLGGVDHAAQLVRQGEVEASHSLVLGAGPMFFMNPELEAGDRQQTLLKSSTMAAALADLKFLAWAPGANDFAAGPEQLHELTRTSGATLLAGNLKLADLPFTSERVLTVGDVKVGIAGVTLPDRVGEWAVKPDVSDAEASLRQSLTRLEQQGVPLRIALVAAPRGAALRLAETVAGYQIFIVGKSLDRGESNEGPIPPVLIGKTLVVQGPNHLQALGIVDLYLRDGKFDLVDASGVTNQEARASLERRIEELAKRLVQWRAAGNVSAKDLEARRVELEGMRTQLAALVNPQAPSEGSFFRYQLREVREGVGEDPKVAERLRTYYRQVNEHNKLAFADRLPPPLEPGASGYVGVERCATCHKEEHAFWATTPHSRAYRTLSDQFKEFNLDCVKCHVTGYERPGGSTVTHVDGLKDVQCENCHGAGSLHAANGKRESIQRVPSPEVCKSCHHAPHVADDWDVNAAWPHVLGPGHGR